jgi:hypothetical protein
MDPFPLEDLKDDVTKARKESHWGRFVPENKIKDIFKRSRIASISSVQLGKSFSSSLKVIAILLCIDKVKALETWLSDGPTDNDLPLRYDDEKKVFKTISETSTRTFKPFSPWSNHCTEFCDRQWQFLAPVLDERDLTITMIHEKCPLPIMWPEKKDGESSGISTAYDQGAFSFVDQVKVHYKHLKPCVVSFNLAPFTFAMLGR